VKEELAVLELRPWLGGQQVSLESQVAKYPGRIDVYEVNPDNRWPEYDRAGAVRKMLSFVGRRYGWWSLFLMACLRIPILRCFIRPNLDDDANGKLPLTCAHACALADRVGGGVDPVLNLSDRFTEPADLARSPIVRYRFTLIP